MKRYLKILVSVFAVGLAGEALRAEPMPEVKRYTGEVKDRSLICMTNDTVQKQAGLPQVYQGKTYYLCCEGCRQGFKADPDKFSHAHDPISNERVDKAEALVYGFQGKAYFFANRKNLEVFSKYHTAHESKPEGHANE